MARKNQNKLYVQDVTLRDGMHAIRHQYASGARSRRSPARLTARRVDAIEICHGDGITGATFNYGFGAHDDGEWIAAVAEECKHAVVTVLLLPGIGTVHDLKHAYDAGARSVRIATHCTEADVSRQHIEAARALGMDTVGFLMMAHMASAEKLVEQAKLMESYGAECVYVTDFGRSAAARAICRAGEGVPRGAEARDGSRRPHPPQSDAGRGQCGRGHRSRRCARRRFAGRHGRGRGQRADRGADRRAGPDGDRDWRATFTS